ncbi:aspartate kinase [Desemzia sp. RIT804]|uniref:aspartate kinase n=1 Tax=Desemzia sp. RIT 804 TaxID=2810209 RepID=UPI00194E70B6|nr:aspartate kinase [Desemzia sp. RIT 804]MBM6614447.1 aspartate kinase [Desemzia sp. RIT 804]
MKVVKFGGSSLASAQQFRKVIQIIKDDSARKIVVVSAPGKRFSQDEKVTDLLISIANKSLAKQDFSNEMNKVVYRYQEIADELHLDEQVMEMIRLNLNELVAGDKKVPKYYIDAFKASGEDNNAKLVAAYFNQEGVLASYVNPQAAGLLVTDEPDNARVLPESYDTLEKLRSRNEVLVFPGFFGYTKEGRLCTFSRGGSDITGAILANGVEAELYENFTDVDAIFAANPAVVKDPIPVAELTYREMRELSYAGFSVLHDEALEPAFKKGIPVVIKNTNNPASPGTKIVKEHTKEHAPIIGIASSSGFINIYIEKYLMNREIGFGRKVLQLLESHGLSYEHTPSGIDNMTVILRGHQMTPEIELALIKSLKEKLLVDSVTIERDVSLIMLVGEGMRNQIGTMAIAAQALRDRQINIDMVNQGASENSVMFGIKEKEEDRAVEALYHAFFEESL